jgi:hypothetical protein
LPEGEAQMAEENPGNGRNETAFYVVLSLVFLITVSSLALALWRSSQRKDYVDREVHRVEASVPKGDVKPSDLQNYEYEKNLIREEKRRTTSRTPSRY